MLRVPCETYSRVVGYYRPVSQWNKGQQEQFVNRKTIDLKKVKDERKDTSN